MKEVSLWNDLPWFNGGFQAEKVQICSGNGKFLGFSILSNHSENFFGFSFFKFKAALSGCGYTSK